MFFLKTIYHWIVDLIFPHVCPLCHSIIKDHSSVKKNILFCTLCLSNNKEVVPIRITYRSYIIPVYSLYLYDDICQILYGKYHKKSHYYDFLGSQMSLYIKKYNMFFDYIVYVPQNRIRKALRWFNHAELMALQCGSGLHVEVLTNLLYAIKIRPAQATLSKEERIKNMKSAFSIEKGERIKGKKILIIDDIYTTGSTIKEIIALCSHYKPDSISVFVAARQ